MSEIKEGNLAEIKDLSVSFMTDAGSIKAIDKISFEIPRKKVIGVVGESGSGKSVTARSLIKLLPETATTSGAVYLSNRAGAEELEVLSLSGEQLREMRGAEAAMVFQEPNSVLNPVYTIGWQIEEGLRAHGMKDKKELRAKSIDILKKVGIPDAETRIDYYPHQFSGGQKQRIVIAMALVAQPRPDSGRRADHRPRRDRAGRNPRPAASGARRVRRIRAHHHPQHGRDRRHRR